MRRLVLLPLLLGGCLAHASGVPAASNALQCAERTAAGLGYQVTSRTGETDDLGSFVAERPVSGGVAGPALGVLEATAWREARGVTRLRVHGSRYLGRRAGVDPTTPGLPPGIATPARNVGGSARRGRYRVSPGPVADDARLVLEQCGRDREIPARREAR